MSSIALLPAAQRRKTLKRIAPQDNDKALLEFQWRGWRARPEQTPPADRSWLVWLLLAGRGFGKTRTGAETVRMEAEGGRATRIALVAPTAADVRDVMVEGESGILAVSPPWFRPRYEPSKRKLTWPNGAVAMCYSADEPERLRGPQHDMAWGRDISSVCRAKGQFSCWLPGDPNRAKLLDVDETDPEFRIALRVAGDAIAGRIEDPTVGATSYKVDTLPWPYSWGRPRLPLAVIGKHAFFNLQGV